MVFLLIRIMRLCRGRTMHHITASTRTTTSMFHPLETSPSHKCQATVLHPFSANLLQGFQVTPRIYKAYQISIEYQFNEILGKFSETNKRLTPFYQQEHTIYTIK